MTRKSYKLLTAFLAAVLIISSLPTALAKAATYGPEPPVVTAAAAILIEAETGRVLYGKDERKRIYPASMTKILTALIALDYLDPAEIIVVGAEIKNVPADSSKAGHAEGESITVMNLLRGLIIRSGNETACVLALAVARKATGDPDITYSAAERYFCGLMNERAKDAGALDSNFNNPHGYHKEGMYSTAYDIAMITREAMKNEVFRQLAGETAFAGSGSAGLTGTTTKNYNWTTSNELLLPGDNNYPYATGVKTGRQSVSGDCLAGSAAKDGVSLISVVCNDPDPGRWADSAALFDYGFENYAYRNVCEAWTVAGELYLDDPRKQEPDTIELLITETVTAFLSQAELDRVVMDMTLLPEFLTTNPDADRAAGLTEGTARIKTPVEDGQMLGSIAFSLDGEVLYAGYVIAGRDALERSFSSDMDYYMERLKGFIFTVRAIPFWIVAFLLLALAVYLIRGVFKRRHRERYMFMSGSKRRFK